MKKYYLAACLGLMAFSTAALAIDRDAKMIDTFSVDLQELDDADGYGASIWGEKAVQAKGWAVLAGIGMGRISPDAPVVDVDYYRVALGLKYYLTPVTSFSAVGQYDSLNVRGGDPDIKSGILSVKQRFTPADADFAPYAVGSLTFRDRSTFSDDTLVAASISEVMLTVGGGVELSVIDTFSFTFDVGYVMADASDDGAEDLDGWVAAFGMRYYFDGSFFTEN